jgi:hypothetical protein
MEVGLLKRRMLRKNGLSEEDMVAFDIAKLYIDVCNSLAIMRKSRIKWWQILTVVYICALLLSFHVNG